MADTPMDMIGESAGSYRIVRKLGEGGMGVVYLAEHPLLGRKAAVKMLLPEFSTNPAMLQRFFNEARATTMLNHPGIIEVFDFGHHPSGSAFIVMEFLEGESLAARLKREGRLSINLQLEIAGQIAHAVGAAHEKGIVHRDLKPDNVYLLPAHDHPSGIRVKVLDFGIAKLTGAASAASAPGEKTRAGLILGTPAYMSPEQCHGAAMVDTRTDIYALGVMMYEMAVGHPPYVAENPMDIILAHVSAPIPPLEEEGVEPGLASVIRRALAKKPEERFQSMAELSAEVERLRDGRKPSGPYAVPAQMVTTVLPVPGQLVTPSTLGEMTAEMVAKPKAPPRRRWVLPVALASVALVGGGSVLAWFVVNRARPAATTVYVAPPPPERVEPPAPVMVKLRIESEPAGADVYRAADGLRIGRTPYTVEVAAAPGEAVFLLKLAGYEDGRVVIPAHRSGTASATLAKLAPPPEKEVKPTPPLPDKQKPAEPPRKKKRDLERGILNPYGA